MCASPGLPLAPFPACVQADDHGDHSSEGSNSSLVAVECFVCGRRFEKQKALFGHMKSHPEREWRGVRPDPDREGPWRKRKRRRKLYMETEAERVAGRELYLLGDYKRVFGTMMTSVTNAKEIAPAVTEGGGSRSVCNEIAHQFPMHCGLCHRPRMQCQGKMAMGKGVVGCREEKMVAKPQRRERGCLLDLNLPPPPLEEEHEELGEKKI